MIENCSAKVFLHVSDASLESLMAFKRAGCAGVLTYYAVEAAKVLRG